MPRYKVNARFGVWSIGEEFESTDPYHEKLAENGLLSVVGSPRPAPAPRAFDFPDGPSGEESV